MIDVRGFEIGSFQCLSRISMDDDTTFGMIVGVCGDFVCIKEYLDYSYVGYNIISSSDIKEVFSHDTDLIVKKIADEDCWNKIGNNFSFLQKIDSWSSLCKSVFDQGMYASYELSSGEVHIGKICFLKNDGIKVLCVNQDFSRDNIPFMISFDEIVNVLVGTHYVDIYRRFSSK